MSARRRAFEQRGNVAICQHVADLLNNVAMLQYVSMSPSFRTTRKCCNISACHRASAVRQYVQYLPHSNNTQHDQASVSKEQF